MLAEALESNRMLSVAMQRPGSTRESTSPVAGLGLIRVSVAHRDGTSHLILQGLTRVELQETLRYKPYRVQRIRPLKTPPCDNVKVDALVAKVRELLEERIDLGLPFPNQMMTPQRDETNGSSEAVSPKQMLNYLDSITDPEQAVDLVSWSV